MYQGHRHDDNDDVDDDYNDGDDGHDDDSHNDNYDDKGNRSELRSWERGGRKGQKITKVHQDHFCTWLLTGFNRLGWTYLAGNQYNHPWSKRLLDRQAGIDNQKIKILGPLNTLARDSNWTLQSRSPWQSNNCSPTASVITRWSLNGHQVVANWGPPW